MEVKVVLMAADAAFVVVTVKATLMAVARRWRPLEAVVVSVTPVIEMLLADTPSWEASVLTKAVRTVPWNWDDVMPTSVIEAVTVLAVLVSVFPLGVLVTVFPLGVLEDGLPLPDRPQVLAVQVLLLELRPALTLK
jgi:hypothetical protein